MTTHEQPPYTTFPSNSYLVPTFKGGFYTYTMLKLPVALTQIAFTPYFDYAGTLTIDQDETSAIPIWRGNMTGQFSVPTYPTYTKFIFRSSRDGVYTISVTRLTSDVGDVVMRGYGGINGDYFTGAATNNPPFMSGVFNYTTNRLPFVASTVKTFAIFSTPGTVLNWRVGGGDGMVSLVTAEESRPWAIPAGGWAMVLVSSSRDSV